MSGGNILPDLVISDLNFSDDGCGMDEELVKEINSAIFEKSKESHFGVRNICERVKLLNGKVTFSSAPDFGTHITVEV